MTKIEAATPDLKWLFIAEYDDGSQYHQTPVDAAVGSKPGSAFTDVDVARVVKFGLTSDEETWAVDLKDGSFWHDGKKFHIFDPDVVLSDRELIYWRRVYRSLGVTPDTMLDLGFRMRYYFGWKAKDKDGNIIERTLWIE